MIVLEFLYKGSPIKVVPFKDLEFTEENKQKLRADIKSGLIAKPENYDVIAFYPAQDNAIWRKYG